MNALYAITGAITLLLFDYLVLALLKPEWFGQHKHLRLASNSFLPDRSVRFGQTAGRIYSAR
ncbi:MAG: hypothetical protein KJZ52_04060, partial [Anaerolineales bacterium]|nr:hypothetical protein [Anaerolineales bacterium]